MLRIDIDTGNQAFEDDAVGEIDRIFRDIIRRARRSGAESAAALDGMVIRDVNGNTVGTISAQGARMHADGLTDDDVAELADDYADSRYDDMGEAAYGRED